MSEEFNELDYEEGPPEDQTPALGVGLTPFGLIGLTINDSDGTKGYIIKSPDEAWRVAGHILALAGMMVQSMYAVAMKEQEMMNEIAKGGKVWTPGG